MIHSSCPFPSFHEAIKMCIIMKNLIIDLESSPLLPLAFFAQFGTRGRQGDDFTILKRTKKWRVRGY